MRPTLLNRAATWARRRDESTGALNSQRARFLMEKQEEVSAMTAAAKSGLSMVMRKFSNSGMVEFGYQRS
jgi:hypothetical protein